MKMKYEITYKTSLGKPTLSIVMIGLAAAERIKASLKQYGALEVEMLKI